MELGRLTFLCMNLACLGALVTLVFLALTLIRPAARKRPRIYSEPPDMGRSGGFRSLREQDSGVQAAEKHDRVESFE